MWSRRCYATEQTITCTYKHTPEQTLYRYVYSNWNIHSTLLRNTRTKCKTAEKRWAYEYMETSNRSQQILLPTILVVGCTLMISMDFATSHHGRGNRLRETGVCVVARVSVRSPIRNQREQHSRWTSVLSRWMRNPSQHTTAIKKKKQKLSIHNVYYIFYLYTPYYSLVLIDVQIFGYKIKITINRTINNYYNNN